MNFLEKKAAGKALKLCGEKKPSLNTSRAISYEKGSPNVL